MVIEGIIRLPLAGVLGAALAFRPKRRGTPTRTPAVVQTQIILTVVGRADHAGGRLEPGPRLRHRRRRQPDPLPLEDRRPEGRRGDAVLPGRRAGLGRRSLRPGRVRDGVPRRPRWRSSSRSSPTTSPQFDAATPPAVQDAGGPAPALRAGADAASASSTRCARSRTKSCPTTSRCRSSSRPNRVTNAILKLDPTGKMAVDWDEKKAKKS